MKYCLSSKAEHEIAIIRNRKPRGECRGASVVIRTDRTVKQGSGKRLQGENVHVYAWFAICGMTAFLRKNFTSSVQRRSVALFGAAWSESGAAGEEGCTDSAEWGKSEGFTGLTCPFPT